MNPNQPAFIPESAPFTAEQRAWLNGFMAGLFASSQMQQAPAAPAAPVAPKPSLLILFGSQTGTAEQLARKLARDGEQQFAARALPMSDFAQVDFAKEQRLLIVTSTWGDGDPPDNAVPFWNFLNGTAAPQLTHLSYSVLALGDSSYADFCGAGKKFDLRLEQLGAKRLHARSDCDKDYEATAKQWCDAVLKKFLECGVSSPSGNTGSSESRELKTVTGSATPHSTALSYGRQNPFPARLLTNRKLNSDKSEKDTRHFEISLEGAGLEYEVGDALGVVPRNAPKLVEELLAALRCDGEEAVKNGGPTEMPLRKALLEHFEIRQVGLSLLETFATRSGDNLLRELLDSKNKPALDQFLHGREVIDLFLAYPKVTFTPAEFVALLRKLNPRLYSIASSPKAHPGEVHLTVAAVRYQSHGRNREGVCSTFLADRIEKDATVPVFVQPSHGFRLPKNGETPIIMIGPGTGIAPFRAFLEERRAIGAHGKAWLFFGDQRRDCDFLYRDELEAMNKAGVLSRFDTAFSRDQAEKVYVQHRLLQNASDVWAWLEQGAHLYVCGDAKRMAKDVDAALHQVIEKGGGRTAEQASAYVQQMKVDKRYQRDVY